MADQVTVAMLGNPNHAFDNGAFQWHEGGAREFDIAYDELPKATLDVRDDETVGAILVRAAQELGIQLPDWAESLTLERAIGFCAFYREGENPKLTTELILLDEAGRARWSVPFKEATFAELVRASDAGVFEGDPRRPYLPLLGPQGNGVLATWSTLIEGFHVLLKVLEGFAAVEGARALAAHVIRTARDRIRGGQEALQEHYLEWDERGARPDNFPDLLARGPWHGQDLADRLGCSREEAEAILWSYGYTPTAEGQLWRRGGDEAGEFLRTAVDDASHTFHFNPGPGFERMYHARVTGLLEGGDLPDLRHDETDWPEPPDHPPEEEGPVLKELVPCTCGRKDCELEISFYRGGVDYEALILRFSKEADHCGVDPGVMGVVLGILARGPLGP